ncbi:sec-independent protein translocase protein TatB [Devosia sp. YR412]|uniref:Sec-independent protein translocase protein TatB n=1 Tax=Devosia sp. YR412 TaxID=1881030 RepID=UPI0008B352B9|nr:Sec-independent protein translocase protein TatB [Devosia sp. YR412]SEQ58812.1 sec-independent protein translocase protein TatB [Devosia sp. YR412]
MLGLGWTEMLVIGVVALIVIGPKDLPVVMNRVGKIIGQIRRMGSEFQREINKTTGLDEVRNLRNSITAPLKKTSDEIRREFNAMTPTGPKPSGIIKPTDPAKESVVDAIKSQAGMTPAKSADEVAAEAGFKPPAPAPVASKATTPVKGATKPKAPARAKAAPTSPVIKTDLAPLDAVPAPAEAQPIAKPAAKPRSEKVVAPKPVRALPTEPADSPATKTPKARAPRKTAAAKAGDI